MTPQEPPLAREAIDLARKHVQSGDFTDADYALCQLAERVEKLEGALKRIAKNEKEVFDDDEGCNVSVSLDVDEMVAIADEVLKP